MGKDSNLTEHKKDRARNFDKMLADSRRDYPNRGYGADVGPGMFCYPVSTKPISVTVFDEKGNITEREIIY